MPLVKNGTVTQQPQNPLYFLVALTVAVSLMRQLMLLLKEVGALVMPLLTLMLEVEALVRTLLALLRELEVEG